MKQIVSFNIARLRVEEDFGFLKLIATETDNLPKNGEEDRPGELSMTASVPTTLTTSVTTFKNAVDAFDNALKDSASTPSTALAAEADSARDNAWRGANNYLKAMTAHPANDVRQTAIEAKTLFDKYGDPTTLPQTEESGVLHNLLQDLKAIDGSKLTAITFDTWLANLESCETAFLADRVKFVWFDDLSLVQMKAETNSLFWAGSTALFAAYGGAHYSVDRLLRREF